MWLRNVNTWNRHVCPAWQFVPCISSASSRAESPSETTITQLGFPQENIRVEAVDMCRFNSGAYTICEHIQIHTNITIFTVVYGVADNFIMRLQASCSPNSRTTWPNWANHLDSLHPWVEGLVKLYNLSRAIASGPTCLIWNWIDYHRFSFLPIFVFPSQRQRLSRSMSSSSCAGVYQSDGMLATEPVGDWISKTLLT